MSTLWDNVSHRHPALSFSDGLRLDALFRRQDALRAILGAPVRYSHLWSDVVAELAKTEELLEQWDRDTDVKIAAWCSWP